MKTNNNNNTGKESLNAALADLINAPESPVKEIEKTKSKKPSSYLSKIDKFSPVEPKRETVKKPSSIHSAIKTPKLEKTGSLTFFINVSLKKQLDIYLIEESTSLKDFFAHAVTVLKDDEFKKIAYEDGGYGAYVESYTNDEKRVQTETKMFFHADFDDIKLFKKYATMHSISIKLLLNAIILFSIL